MKEGIPVGVDWALRQDGWGNAARKKSGVPSLLKYGGALAPFVSEIEAVLGGWTRANNSKNNQMDATVYSLPGAEHERSLLIEASVS